MISRHRKPSRKPVRQTVRPARSFLRIESLESRLPLAGNVTAQLIGSTLFLTGDSLGNEIAVASVAAGKIAVIGNATTVNGSTTPLVTKKAVTNIVATLNGGDDFVWFGNDAQGFANQLASVGITPTPFIPSTLQSAIDGVSAGVTAFSLPGNLTVTTADGSDFVSLIGTVGGSITATLGSATSDGFNGFLIGDYTVESAVNRVGGSVTVVGGDQNEGVLIYGTNVGGGISMALGNGYNRMTCYGYGATIGSFAYTGGRDNETVFVEGDITVRNSVTLFTGPSGPDFVEVGGVYGGSVVINTGAGGGDDAVFVEGATIKRDLSVTTGAGADDIIFSSDTIGGSVTIASGASDDTMFSDVTSVALNTVINAGDGNDTVELESMTVRYNLFVYMGAGDDVLTVGDTTALAAFLYGGTGINTLNIDPASLTGIRRLRYYQFQTVNIGGNG